jgi:four helix bundle protein
MAGKISRIEDLMVWQNARTISKGIYTITRKPEFERDYRFVQQIRAAAGSIMDNIAEGFGRGGNKEFLQFLSIARGSCQEVLSQLYRAYDVQYISEEEFDKLKGEINTISAMIYHLVEKIRQSELKGTKYS